MRQITPFIFPALALLIVIVLLFRWYSLRTAREGRLAPGATSTQVEELDLQRQATEGAKLDLQPGAPDMQTVDLKPQATTSAEVAQATGVVRFRLENEEVSFGVFADLPELKSGTYQVWVQGAGQPTKVFALEMGKAGYTGSMTVNRGQLPIDVIVSYEVTNDNKVEQIILKGRIERP